MNKPEKRKLTKGSIYLQYDKGFNHAYSEWEGFLPNKGEIEKLLVGKITHLLGCEYLAEISEFCTCNIRGRRKDLSTELSKRIGTK